MLATAVQSVVETVYPPECAGCRDITTAAHGLCARCWAETSFISGTICDSCGVPVPSAPPGNRSAITCESCTSHPPGWDRGRAAILYEGTGRRVILRLKHGDRLDHARVLAGWMARAGADLLDQTEIIAPVPLHWRRILFRRYNQAAELIRHLPLHPGQQRIYGLLRRPIATPKMERADRIERFRLQRSSISIDQRYAAEMSGRRVLLVDDVMTSGATLAACADACSGAGATGVDVLVAARVAREGFTPI